MGDTNIIRSSGCNYSGCCESFKTIVQGTDVTQPVLLLLTCLALLPVISHPSDKRYAVSISAMFTDAKFFSDCPGKFQESSMPPKS
jgi:hypothetical protein